jgi:putative NIF3 family GTP cyclohydrolase 1 type 2
MPDISVSVDAAAVTVSCPGRCLAEVLARLPGDLADSARLTKHELPPLPGTGAGRRLALLSPLQLGEVVARTKAHLGLSHLRLAMANGAELTSPVETIAVCAGSGAR